MNYTPFQWLIDYYDKSVNMGKPICPIAHTYLSAQIQIMISQDGKFMAAKLPSVKGELICAPCTIRSETRTSNIAPHLLHDQIGYVSNFNPKKHKEYIAQLKNYIKECPHDVYASAIYRYVVRDTLLFDIKSILPEKPKIPLEKTNVVFAVCGLENVGADLEWTKWYLSQLKPNGFCYITGEMEYIPNTYPRCIRTSSDRGTLFLKGSNVGYINAQKITKSLQYMIYGQQNYDKTEAE